MAGTHGGAQFEVIGNDLSRLDRRNEVVPADVLDAWFDPAPGVIEALRGELPWSLRSSPPAQATGMERATAALIGVDPCNVVAGAGSSDLIFRALREWLSRSSRVYLLDPTYSEYRFVCEQVIGCTVECGSGLPDERDAYDLIVVVNPNNPTGETYTPMQIGALSNCLREGGRVWVDEAYRPFTDAVESMASIAAKDPRFVVCQSLSKCLALSGVRAAYIVASKETGEALRRITPPWIVSTPATLAVTAAIAEPGYYTDMYAQTRALRRELAGSLQQMARGSVTEGAANWVTIELGVPASLAVASCRERGVLVRDGTGMFKSPPSGFVRIAVRSRVENERIVEALAHATAQPLLG